MQAPFSWRGSWYSYEEAAAAAAPSTHAGAGQRSRFVRSSRHDAERGTFLFSVSRPVHNPETMRLNIHKSPSAEEALFHGFSAYCAINRL